MSSDVLDAVIVGQGLAGTALAWQLVEAGWRIAVLDDNAPVSASKISAGLFTPIMGRKFSQNDPAAIEFARDFYERIATRTGTRLVRDIPAVRVFADEADRALWMNRQKPLLHHLLEPQPDPLLPADVAASPFGGFVMRSAQLDAAAYIAISRSLLPVISTFVSADGDVDTRGTEMRVLGLSTRRLIFCEGFSGAGNPYFPELNYRSAKGDILMVRLSRDLPPTSIHRRFWMAPTSARDVFRVGATFDWSNLDHIPTTEGRAELENELDTLLTCGYEVIGHMAAVRPIVRRDGVIGASRRDPRIFILNGLGTRGASRAPILAHALARHLIEGVSLSPALDVATAR